MSGFILHGSLMNPRDRVYRAFQAYDEATGWDCKPYQRRPLNQYHKMSAAVRELALALNAWEETQTAHKRP